MPKEKPKVNIGEVIRSYRSDRGLSQGDIERRTGLLRCYLSRVENGTQFPRSRRSRRLQRPWKSASPIFSREATRLRIAKHAKCWGNYPRKKFDFSPTLRNIPPLYRRRQKARSGDDPQDGHGDNRRQRNGKTTSAARRPEY